MLDVLTYQNASKYATFLEIQKPMKFLFRLSFCVTLLFPWLIYLYQHVFVLFQNFVLNVAAYHFSHIPFCEVISSSIKLLFLKSDKYYSDIPFTYCNSITYLLHIFATIEVVDTLSVPRVQTVQNTSILPHILPWHNYFLQQVDFRFQYTLYHGSVQIYDVKIILT